MIFLFLRYYLLELWRLGIEFCFIQNIYKIHDEQSIVKILLPFWKQKEIEKKEINKRLR